MSGAMLDKYPGMSSPGITRGENGMVEWTAKF